MNGAESVKRASGSWTGAGRANHCATVATVFFVVLVIIINYIIKYCFCINVPSKNKRWKYMSEKNHFDTKKNNKLSVGFFFK